MIQQTVLPKSWRKSSQIFRKLQFYMKSSQIRYKSPNLATLVVGNEKKIFFVITEIFIDSFVTFPLDKIGRLFFRNYFSFQLNWHSVGHEDVEFLRVHQLGPGGGRGTHLEREQDYSGDPNTGHSNNGIIWITDFCYSLIQAMTWITDF